MDFKTTLLAASILEVEAEEALATITGTEWRRGLNGGQVCWQGALIRYEILHRSVFIDAQCTASVGGITRAARTIVAKTIDELERAAFKWGIDAALDAR